MGKCGVECRIPQTIRTQISNPAKKAFRKNLKKGFSCRFRLGLHSRQSEGAGHRRKTMNKITTLTIAITIAAFAGSAAAGPQIQDSPQSHKMAGMSSKAAASTKKKPAASAKKKHVTAAKNRMNMPKKPAKKASGKMDHMDMNAKGDGMPMGKEMNMDKPMMNKDMDMMDKEMNMRKMEKKPVKKAPAKPKDTKMKDMDDMDMM
jgi:hypothetical protein